MCHYAVSRSQRMEGCKRFYKINFSCGSELARLEQTGISNQPAET